ncbi:MAG: DUF4230 domain-containing protein [Clostridium sp.]|nr:DUF4230 domain-containing protein [Clostridium sp.]
MSLENDDKHADKKERKIEKNKVKKSHFGMKFGIAIAIGIVIFMIRLLYPAPHTPSLTTDLIEGEEGKVSTISAATLEKVFDLSELSTADYTYNAIATAYDEGGTTVKYYVAYEGIVKAGIDFRQIKFDIHEEEKVINITIPEVAFTEKTVSPGTLEYIFKDKKSETENVYQEAFELCKKDLAERTDKEEDLLQLARENAAAVVEALVTPWVEQIDNEYTVEIQ